MKNFRKALSLEAFVALLYGGRHLQDLEGVLSEEITFETDRQIANLRRQCIETLRS